MVYCQIFFFFSYDPPPSGIKGHQLRIMLRMHAGLPDLAYSARVQSIGLLEENRRNNRG